MTSGSVASIVDTNILVYAADLHDAFKRERALAILDRLDAVGRGVVSVQNLHEFISVATKRLKPPMPMDDVVWVARHFLQHWRILPLTSIVTAEAMRGVERYKFAWWDALIWATARVHGISVVLSEDFNSGAVLDGVRFVNPFEPAFSPAAL